MAYFVAVVCPSELDEPVYIVRDTLMSANEQAQLEVEALSEIADDVWVTILCPDGVQIKLTAGADYNAARS